jgi:flagellar biosynthesis/type III secretory pathway protein FliH
MVPRGRFDMSALRSLALVTAFALSTPAVALAQWGQPRFQPGYGEGYERGQRAGNEDHRRGDHFSFIDEGDYRRGDIGYRSQFGNRDRYRDSFRRGFQEGYRAGYGPEWRGNGVPFPGRGVGIGRIAHQTGLNDGYEAGLDDGRDNRRFDPIGEGRYRSADRGYERHFGPREIYKNAYREAFKDGYARGYADGRRYDRQRSGGFFGFGFRF